ncbi:MAG: SDR family NAD(P)-dependent oxidoreductase [Flavobacteriaceae bacterium]|nr:SDR family NAD(P)-dependent oxidoreductase [Flavobacteriaceae bacterium]
MSKRISTSSQKRLRENYGPWALITGATSGIGKAATFQLAEAGFNLLIVSRNVDSLEEMTTQLESQFGISANYLAVDLSQSGSYPKVIKAASDYDIGLVLLSAGYGTSGSFTQAKLETELNMLDVNCRAVLVLAHFFAKQFKHKTKGPLYY